MTDAHNRFNKSLPCYWMSKDGVNELYEGVVNKMYEKATIHIDPASAFGDYGCAVVHRLNDAGEIEIVRIEYLEPCHE